MKTLTLFVSCLTMILLVACNAAPAGNADPATPAASPTLPPYPAGSTATPFPTTVAPTSTPLPPGSQLVVDRLNGLQVVIPAGWYASVPPAGAVAGATIIQNYDPNSASLPANYVKIQIGSGPLNGQTLEQWVAARRQPETGGGPVFVASEAESYTLNNQQGYAFTWSLDGELHTQEIAIYGDAPGSRVLSIGLSPVSSPALTEALALLASLRPLDPSAQ